VLAVLRRRDFALLWSSGLISVAGDWVLMVALPYYVFARTGSPLATAAMTVAELAPAVLLTSLTGVLADRWNLRTVLVVANVAQALVVAMLLLVPGGWLWLVYVVAALQSTVAAFGQPAESALLPSLVPREQLTRANALNVLNNRIGRLAGVPLGAALFAAWGLPAVVVVDAASFLVAALLVAPVEPPPRQQAEEPGRRRFWHEWLAGLVVVRDDRTIATLFVVFTVMTFGGTMLDPLYAPWVREVLGQGVTVLALLTTVSSVAGIAGSLVVGALGARVTARTLIGWSSVAAGLLLLVKFAVPVLGVAIVLTAVGGLVSVASAVGVETLAQERTPVHVRGRVFGTLQASVWLASLLGAATGGVVAQVFSLPVALDVAASLVLASGLLVLRAIPRDVDGIPGPCPPRRRRAYRRNISGGA
jgi:predicted MFS family arabinose efflux permease